MTHASRLVPTVHRSNAGYLLSAILGLGICYLSVPAGAEDRQTVPAVCSPAAETPADATSNPYATFERCIDRQPPTYPRNEVIILEMDRGEQFVASGQLLGYWFDCPGAVKRHTWKAHLQKHHPADLSVIIGGRDVTLNPGFSPEGGAGGWTGHVTISVNLCDETEGQISSQINTVNIYGASVYEAANSIGTYGTNPISILGSYVERSHNALDVTGAPGIRLTSTNSLKACMQSFSDDLEQRLALRIERIFCPTLEPRME